MVPNPPRSVDTFPMSFTVFLGNLPPWVTADDIRSWLSADSLVADNVKVIRNPESQESKGFAFIEAPNQDEMQSIIRRFDRAPLEDRMLRANQALPPKSRKPGGPPGTYPGPGPGPGGPEARQGPPPSSSPPDDRARQGNRRKRPPKAGTDGPPSAFADELSKAL